MRTSRRLLPVGMLGVMGIAISTSCAGHDSSSKRNAAPITGEFAAAYPSETLADWVSYGDAVVVATISAEEEVPEEIEHDSALYGRNLTLDLDDVVWSHPSATPIPEQFVVESLGWVITESGKHEFNRAGATRMQVGNQYLMPLVISESEIALLSDDQVLPMSTDARRVAEINQTQHQGLAAEQLSGLTPEEVSALFLGIVPDPIAEANRHLPPHERFLVVSATKESANAGG